MTAQDAITRKLEAAVSEIKAYEKEIQDLRFKVSVNEGVIGALRGLLAEIAPTIEVVSPTAPISETNESVPSGRTVREIVGDFLATEPGRFTTDDLFSYVQLQDRGVTRSTILNLLSYEKTRKRIEHVETGVYRYPPTQDLAVTSPSIFDDSERESAASSLSGSSSGKQTPSDLASGLGEAND